MRGPVLNRSWLLAKHVSHRGVRRVCQVPQNGGPAAQNQIMETTAHGMWKEPTDGVPSCKASLALCLFISLEDRRPARRQTPSPSPRRASSLRAPYPAGRAGSECSASIRFPLSHL